MGSVLDEVVRPDMVGVLHPQTNAGAICEPETTAFGLLLGNLQPLTPPDAFDSRVIYQPASITQQGGNLAVAVAAILPGQFDHVSCKLFGIFSAPRDLALRRAVLPERRAGATLGDMPMISDKLVAGAPARVSWKFPWVAFCRISLSSVTSLTPIWWIASTMPWPCETRTSTLAWIFFYKVGRMV
jgi:hypothetical protein